MDLKDLLVKQGFDLDKVMVLRHRPAEPCTPEGVAMVWLPIAASFIATK